MNNENMEGDFAEEMRAKHGAGAHFSNRHSIELAREKESHPERFCSESGCLWRIRGEHGPLVSRETGRPAQCPAHPAAT